MAHAVTGKVSGAVIVVEGELAEGTEVTALLGARDEFPYELTPGDCAAIEEGERELDAGQGIPAGAVLEELRRRSGK